MKHIYENIEGWFDFEHLYSKIVERAESGSKFLELGTYQGKSASYMAVEIANSNKDIEFHCVDIWQGDNTIDRFLENTKTVKEFIIPHQMESGQASLTFEDGYFDFVFIDAGHDYTSVTRDIEFWSPKLKKNGILAGHDYYTSWPEVIHAVNVKFPNSAKVISGGCWMVSFEDGEPVENL